jgi:endonuclease/exonuclease/phosphatase family metal-dependent hydrolase
MRRSSSEDFPQAGAPISAGHESSLVWDGGRRHLSASRSSRLRLALIGLFLTAAGLGVPLAAGVGVAQASNTFPLTVMTRNLDSGSDYGPIFSAQTQPEFLSATTSVWQEVQASDPPERMAGIAQEIADTEPEIVSLQEAGLYRTGPFSTSGVPQAQNVVYDQLAELMSSLSADGAHYRVVASLSEFDVEVPTLLGSLPGYDVRETDRDVMLVRSDLPSFVLSVANVQSGHYASAVSLPTPLGPITAPRGWISADVTSFGKTERVIATHLEELSTAVATAQASELLSGPGATNLPLILACDCNTGPGVSSTYDYLISHGLTDTWTATRPNDPGYTWPLHLEDPVAPSTPYQRIDLVLGRGVIPVFDFLVGSTPAALTASGLWPSDHAGVFAITG